MPDLQILYLDNNSYLAAQVKIRLEWNSYRVTTADNDQELLSKLLEGSYDLLIIDYLTPNQNAFSLLELIKLQKVHCPPVIIVSSEKGSRLGIKAMQLGCLDFLIKDPLLHLYIDQLSYSIFQTIEKLKISKKQAQPQKTALSHFITEPAQTINWQYIPSQELVLWKPPSSSVSTSFSYDEFISKIHLEDLALVKTQNNICLFSQQAVEYSFRYLSDNNQLITFHTRVMADVDSNNVVNRLYGYLHAFSSQQMTDKNLRLKLSFLDSMTDAVFITDAQSRIISINDAFASLCGYSEQDVLNKKVCLLNTEKFDEAFFNQIANKLINKHNWQGEVLIRHKLGYSVPVWESIHILKDATGNISQSISVLRDLSQQKEYEESIIFQANYDPLTELPNRTLFLDRLTNIIKQSVRNNSKFALMLLDLNKFKWINDTLGHHSGDILLQETAKKLLDAVRKSDTVARVGGDEFSIIVSELDKVTDAELIARKIFNAFKQAIIIEKQEIFITGSIGISIFPDDGNDIDSLQKNADSAMYKAKKKGSNNYFYYTPALQHETEKRLKLIEDMHSAMRNKEFTLHYQPIIDMVTKKVASAETLLRWNHPQTGYIPLSDFIPIAEESGLIRKIGNWVINEVAANIQRWSELGLPSIDISLNQSVAQYSSSECHIEWLDILKNKQISAKCITFELSEQIFIDQNKTYLNSIKHLKRQGIQISLDGFGTGYSSLSYLQKFPVDVIKIDRSYIKSMIDDPTHAIFVETIIILANKLGIKVIATGVENLEQLTLLKQQCRYAQGYYFSKPLPLNEFEKFIKDQD